MRSEGGHAWSGLKEKIDESRIEGASLVREPVHAMSRDSCEMIVYVQTVSVQRRGTRSVVGRRRGDLTNLSRPRGTRSTHDDDDDARTTTTLCA